METKYEPIKFDSWQELAKFVIDGGEVYYDKKEKVIIYFDKELMINLALMGNLYTKKQPTLEELIAIKPRLCWVWDNDGEKKSVIEIIQKNNKGYCNRRGTWWKSAQMLTDDEIKQFLSDEE